MLPATVCVMVMPRGLPLEEQGPLHTYGMIRERKIQRRQQGYAQELMILQLQMQMHVQIQQP